MDNQTVGPPAQAQPMRAERGWQPMPVMPIRLDETMHGEDALVFSALLRTQVCAAPGRPLGEKPAIEAGLLVRVLDLDAAAVGRAVERLVRNRWVRRTWALDAGGRERVFLAANGAAELGGKA